MAMLTATPPSFTRVVSKVSRPPLQASMEWWLYGPIILAVIMFLLVGTIIEKRIEQAMRSFMERRRTQLLQQTRGGRATTPTDTADLPKTQSLTTSKTPRDPQRLSSKASSINAPLKTVSLPTVSSVMLIPEATYNSTSKRSRAYMTASQALGTQTNFDLDDSFKKEADQMLTACQDDNVKKDNERRVKVYEDQDRLSSTILKL